MQVYPLGDLFDFLVSHVSHKNVIVRFAGWDIEFIFTTSASCSTPVDALTQALVERPDFNFTGLHFTSVVTRDFNLIFIFYSFGEVLTHRCNDQALVGMFTNKTFDVGMARSPSRKSANELYHILINHCVERHFWGDDIKPNALRVLLNDPRVNPNAPMEHELLTGFGLDVVDIHPVFVLALSEKEHGYVLSILLECDRVHLKYVLMKN